MIERPIVRRDDRDDHQVLVDPYTEIDPDCNDTHCQHRSLDDGEQKCGERNKETTNNHSPEEGAVMPVHLPPDRFTFIRQVTEPNDEKLCPEKVQPQQAGIAYDVLARKTAEQMDINLLLLGSYQIYEDQIQITAQLVEVESGVVKPLIMETYPLSDPLIMQTDVANQIRIMLTNKTSEN